MATPEVTFGCNLNVEGYWDVAEFARRAEELDGRIRNDAGSPTSNAQMA